MKQLECFLSAGTPTLSPLKYVDLINDTDVPALGMIVCNSNEFPPTHVSWMKDHVLVNISDSSNSYQQIQRVLSRVSSQYSNILVLKDIRGVIGNHIYECLVSNNAGKVSRLMALPNTGTILNNHL